MVCMFVNVLFLLTLTNPSSSSCSEACLLMDSSSAMLRGGSMACAK